MEAGHIESTATLADF
uniref:Uncharacterized protein n=1 Tax=Rhizophora mucronata TaxID=61149 RepID=A0A2P2IU81_RHIMU